MLCQQELPYDDSFRVVRIGTCELSLEYPTARGPACLPVVPSGAFALSLDGHSGPIPEQLQQVRVESGRGQNRTLRLLSAFWPPEFAGEQDVGLPKG